MISAVLPPNSLRDVLVLTLVVPESLARATRRYRNLKAANMVIDDAGGTYGYSLDGQRVSYM